MSDTATEAPASESVVEKSDYEKALTDAFVTASNKADAEGVLPEDQVLAVQEAFRSVPSAARGRVQGIALKAVLTEGNGSAVAGILDACNNLPKASTKRTAAPEDPIEAGALQAAAILVAYAEVTSDPEHGAAIAEMANGWYTNGLPEEHKDAVLRVASKVAGAAAKRTRGGGGPGSRRTFTETLEDLTSDGRLADGTKLVGPGDAKATIRSGKIRVGNQNFDNFTAAAKATVGEGETKSLNGWAFWTVENAEGEAVSVGSLRRA